MAREKTTGFYFKMSPEEWALVEKRMAQTNIRNKSAFIRKMCIDGHVINVDMEQFGEIGKLLRITANNVNQIARRANSGGGVYREDIADVNNRLTELRECFGNILSLLAEVANPKPGKLFISPPKITDFMLPEREECTQ